MLVAGGALRSAVLLMRKVGMPDCAQALAQAVAQAQLDSKQGSADAGQPSSSLASCFHFILLMLCAASQDSVPGLQMISCGAFGEMSFLLSSSLLL